MRYRALDTNRDSTFGSGYTQFLVNSAAAVVQAVLTRMLLIEGEWFLDTSEGTPYGTEILGRNTQTLYDLAIQNRILETKGVESLESYSSYTNPTTRALSVVATINTIYGPAQLTTEFGMA